jgi:5-methyltetrahydrofolate--homocysteine methyltransferase
LKDASQNALVAARLLNDGEQMEHELTEKYQKLRDDYQQSQDELLSLEEARKQKLNLFD